MKQIRLKASFHYLNVISSVGYIYKNTLCHLLYVGDTCPDFSNISIGVHHKTHCQVVLSGLLIGQSWLFIFSFKFYL